MGLRQISDVRESRRLGLVLVGMASFSEQSHSGPKKGVELDVLALECVKGIEKGELATNYSIVTNEQTCQP
jgi:hypothetical protein